MEKVIAATLLLIGIIFHAIFMRYEIVQFPTQSFPTRFDRLKGELQTKKFRMINGKSVMTWDDAFAYTVEDGKLYANI